MVDELYGIVQNKTLSLGFFLKSGVEIVKLLLDFDNL